MNVESVRKMNVEAVRKDMGMHQGDSLDRTFPTLLELACAARSDMCVLLTGPLEAAQDIAYRIHTISGWRHGEFLIVDCRRSQSLVERLFASPFADDGLPRADLPNVRLVQAGSVLLQEVGGLTPDAQERLAEYVAASRLRKPYTRARWRLIASTSEPLFERVTAGTFSDRLFYRLNTIHLAVPSPAPLAPPGGAM